MGSERESSDIVRGLPRRVSVFVPAYNEAGGIEAAIRNIVRAGEELLEDFEILLVDDGSTDGTGPLVDRLAAGDRRVRVIRHPSNLGLRTGFENALRTAKMEFFAFLPGDNEVHLDTIRNIFRAVGKADVVVPYHTGQAARPWHRKLMTITCRTLLNVLLGNRLKYYQGPNVYPTPVARALPRRSKGFFFLTEMTAYAVRMGVSTVEVPIIHQERNQGQSKAISTQSILRALKVILVLWWEISVQRRTVSLPPVLAARRASDRRGPVLEKVAV